MIDYELINAMREMLFYTVLAVCILTLPTLVVGLIVSIFQAATQINEVTLTFIPKMIVMFTVVYLFGPWMIEYLISISQHYFTNIIHYIR